ncbi:hypothetical protein [Rhodococcus opacus]|uniref:hypothetical protein n=1 Tax=Rhodococcus opacus TaxID=37919 RepID=UPI00155AA029|nr:hypothetical protein [Rhodococcus opacus]
MMVAGITQAIPGNIRGVGYIWFVENPQHNEPGRHRRATDIGRDFHAPDFDEFFQRLPSEKCREPRGVNSAS